MEGIVIKRKKKRGSISLYEAKFQINIHATYGIDESGLHFSKQMGENAKWQLTCAIEKEFEKKIFEHLTEKSKGGLKGKFFGVPVAFYLSTQIDKPIILMHPRDQAEMLQNMKEEDFVD